MAQPYVGEIRLFAGNFAPAGWQFCGGQLLAISENEALFQLIGTTYGGDGQETFALPDLRGRIPIHQGNGFILAESGGAESVTLTTNQIPAHSHTFADARPATTPFVAGAAIAEAGPGAELFTAGATGQMQAATITPTGGSQPHDNFQPYCCINYIISLFGIFPSQT